MNEADVRRISEFGDLLQTAYFVINDPGWNIIVRRQSEIDFRIKTQAAEVARAVGIERIENADYLAYSVDPPFFQHGFPRLSSDDQGWPLVDARTERPLQPPLKSFWPLFGLAHAATPATKRSGTFADWVAGLRAAGVRSALGLASQKEIESFESREITGMCRRAALQMTFLSPEGKGGIELSSRDRYNLSATFGALPRPLAVFSTKAETGTAAVQYLERLLSDRGTTLPDQQLPQLRG